MYRYQFAVPVLTLLICLTGVLRAAEKTSPAQPAGSLEFRLTDSKGVPFELKPETAPGLTVICFLGSECPVARLYGPRLSKLSQEFAQRGVRFVGINSNSQDSVQDITEFAKEHGISFPNLKDSDNKVADQFGAQRMSEVFVVDQALKIRYHGRIDDQYRPGVARGQPTRQDLRIALEELLAGKPVSVSKTAAAGCLIGRIKTPGNNPPVTFCNQVSRVFNQHCVECHRAGEIGPFVLTDYEEAKGWGDTILETIDSGRMPPWNANPKHGKFNNARTMPDADKQVLRDWIAAGMPYGDAAQLPPQKTYHSEWQLSRQPDVVLQMRDRPFKIPASGTIEYQYFVVDPHFTEDRWVSAAQVIPGNRGIVHHCIIFVRPPDGSEFRGVGWLTGYVPGQRSFILPPGRARKVPAGSKLVFQMHYTPNGVEQSDLTKVGINFVPQEEVTHEVYTLLGIDQEFEIPPYKANVPVHATMERFPKRAQLLAIVPHMHLRGQSFQAVSKCEGRTNILLDVPRYDFNWQHVYELAEPLSLEKVDTIEFTARFDNSRNNPVNPDPSQTVTWGDQTWEEMAVAFFEISEPRTPAEQPRQTQVAKAGQKDEDEAERVETATQFFERFDKNKNGIVELEETTLAFQRNGFWRYDGDNDGKLTREEVESGAAFRRRKKR